MRLNELSTYLKKNLKNQSISFVYAPHDLEFNSKKAFAEQSSELQKKVLNHIQSKFSSEVYDKVLKKYRKLHIKTVNLLLKMFLNKIFTQVFPQENENEKQRLIKNYERFFTLAEKDRGDHKMNIYNLFANVYHDLIHLVFDKSIILNKFRRQHQANILRFKNPEKFQQLSQSPVTYNRLEQYNESLVVGLQNMSKNIEANLDKNLVVSYPNQVKYILESILLEAYRTHKLQPELFEGFLVKMLSLDVSSLFNTLRVKVENENQILRYKKILDFIKYFVFKSNPVLISLMKNAYYYYYNFRDFSKKNDIKTAIKHRLEYNKYKNKISDLLFNSIKAFSVLLKNEVKELEKLGSIYQEFKSNLDNNYLKIFELIIKKEKII